MFNIRHLRDSDRRHNFRNLFDEERGDKVHFELLHFAQAG